MGTRSNDPRRLDVAAAAAEGAELTGQWPLTALDRLSDSTAPAVAGEAVSWSARFEQRPVQGGQPEAWLMLAAQARVVRDCQRCLQPLALDLSIRRPLRFVADEATAAALDADSDDDVLAASRQFDLLGLIEDELLLALPLVPKHAVCPDRWVEPADASSDDTDNHPFAALAAHKRGRDH